MYSSSLLVLALAVFGASAQSFGCNGGLLGGVTGVSGFNGGLVNGVSGLNGGLLGGVTGLSGINGGLLGVSGVNNGFMGGVSNVGSSVSTPVLENVPLRLPSLVHPASVQESCNCIKTVVRPQLRKEVFTIPSVQRFVQTTSTPVVETLPFASGSSVDLPTVSGVSSGVETGLIGNGFSGVNGGLVSGGLVSGGLVSGVNSGFGLNGFNGVNGVSGFNGLNGVSGFNGISGFNGVSGFGSSC